MYIYCVYIYIVCIYIYTKIVCVCVYIYTKKFLLKNKFLGVPVMAQQVKDPTLSSWGCRLNPWLCSLG